MQTFVQHIFLMILILSCCIGCGQSSDSQEAKEEGSFISGLFDTSATEKEHSEKMKKQQQEAQEYADQLQEQRLESYH